MTEHVLEAYRADFETRMKDRGLYTVGSFPEGHAVNAHEIRAGVVYKDANVTVTAFATKHTMESYGYRFDTPNRSIVISGDTNPTQATIDACHGCDVLIHEVLTLEWLAKRADFKQYASQFHTTTAQLVELAQQARPVDSLSCVAVAPAGRRLRTLHSGGAPRGDVALSGTGRRGPGPGRLLIIPAA
jgi:hypothetical protein